MTLCGRSFLSLLLAIGITTLDNSNQHLNSSASREASLSRLCCTSPAVWQHGAKADALLMCNGHGNARATGGKTPTTDTEPRIVVGEIVGLIVN